LHAGRIRVPGSGLRDNDLPDCTPQLRVTFREGKEGKQTGQQEGGAAFFLMANFLVLHGHPLSEYKFN
jgi:hypothetical protein